MPGAAAYLRSDTRSPAAQSSPQQRLPTRGAPPRPASAVTAPEPRRAFVTGCRTLRKKTVIRRCDAPRRAKRRTAIGCHPAPAIPPPNHAARRPGDPDPPRPTWPRRGGSTARCAPLPVPPRAAAAPPDPVPFRPSASPASAVAAA